MPSSLQGNLIKAGTRPGGAPGKMLLLELLSAPGSPLTWCPPLGTPRGVFGLTLVTLQRGTAVAQGPFSMTLWVTCISATRRTAGRERRAEHAGD